ncbi:MAG: lytic transglycosylase domain-containing protein [Proteobacteria bacterium]|nr:lytic transglycosylase domain-containing protein [Pseudomonadota bacterium]
MRGIASTLSRLPAARALLAGAAFLAGAAAPAASAQTGAQANAVGNGDETAMAVPRLSPRGNGGGAPAGVALPAPLAPSDAARIRRIFAMQDRGDIAGAARETALLSDDLLTGTILADRDLGRYTRCTADELRAWLDRYADLPDAPAIHALLLRKLPKGETPPPPPQTAALPDPPPPAAQAGAAQDDDPPDRFPPEATPSPALRRWVAERARAAGSTAALRTIAGIRGLAPAQASVLRGDAAQALFAANKDGDVLDLASAERPRIPPDQHSGYASLMGGLAAWRLDYTELSVGYFEDAARAPMASPAVRAAGAFWAGRARGRLGEEAARRQWLRRAAEEPRTFYGLLAQRLLRGDIAADGQETLSQADVDAIDALPGGHRAFALLQVGENEHAEAELRGLWPAVQGNAQLINSLMLVSARAGFADLAAQLAALAPDRADGAPPEALRVKLPRLAPRGGFRIDPPLVYALTRLESNFDADAISPAGAHGLMQIMPVTARYIAGQPSLGGRDLADPATNLDLGQRYVAYLARQYGIEGNLLRMLAAYNSGPGSFARWSASLHDNGDPLLFIEAIPNQETRNFVRHALTYQWLYAARMRMPARSLDELAAGNFPSFTDRAPRATVTAASASDALH